MNASNNTNPSNSNNTSLPSIHEMFPDHLFTSTSSSPIPTSQRRHSTSPYARPIHLSDSPRLHAPQATPSRSYQESSSMSSVRGNDSTTSRRSPQAGYYDFLVCDPQNRTLKHIASSNVNPTPTETTCMIRQAAQQPQPDLVNGTASVFRVQVPSNSSSSSEHIHPDFAHRSHHQSAHNHSQHPQQQHHQPQHSHQLHHHHHHHQSQQGHQHHRRRSGDYSRPSDPSYLISFPITDSRPSSSGSSSFPLRRGSSPDSEGELSSSTRNQDVSQVPPVGPATMGSSNGGKKHICPTCGKRFNRPSSLKIHRNTHTGATPFRCPWPTCGREFNVNSNMRRHYRNHTNPGLARSSSTSVSTGAPPTAGAPAPSATAVTPRLQQAHPAVSSPSVISVASSSSLRAPTTSRHITDLEGDALMSGVSDYEEDELDDDDEDEPESAGEDGEISGSMLFRGQRPQYQQHHNQPSFPQGGLLVHSSSKQHHHNRHQRQQQQQQAPHSPAHSLSSLSSSPSPLLNNSPVPSLRYSLSSSSSSSLEEADDIHADVASATTATAGRPKYMPSWIHQKSMLHPPSTMMGKPVSTTLRPVKVGTEIYEAPSTHFL